MHDTHAHRLLARIGLCTLALSLAAASCAEPQRPAAAPASPAPQPSLAGSDTTPSSTPGTHKLEIHARQVTAADVAVAPDGKWLAFTALGHLFRISTKGGDAKQLTFGPYYDTAPVVSPEGSRIAFVSDRNPVAASSIYLLNLSTGQIEEVVADGWTGQPTWSRDGKSLVYLSYQAAGPWADAGVVGADGRLAQVRQVELATGKVTTLSPVGAIQAVTTLDDGQVLWSELSVQSGGKGATSTLVLSTRPGETAVQLHVDGVIRSVVGDPERRVVILRQGPLLAPGSEPPGADSLLEATLPGGEPKSIGELASAHPAPRFSLADGRVWLGELGGLWHIDRATGERAALPLSVSAELDLLARAPLRPISADPNKARTALLAPRLLPEQAGLVFMAAGYAWQQAQGGETAKRLIPGHAFQYGPAAPSPDGKRLLYQHSEGGVHELRIAPFAGGRGTTVAQSRHDVRFEPAWHPSGQQIAYSDLENGVPEVQLVDLATGKRQRLATTRGPSPAPHFSGDGKWLYFTAGGQLQRIALDHQSQPEPLTALEGSVAHARVAPDGRSLAFRRNDEIWWAPLDPGAAAPVKEASVRRVSRVGGHDFSFSPDSRSLVFAANGEIRRLDLQNGREQALPVRLPPAAAKVPLLIRNVRPWSGAHGRFLAATSIYVDHGRIQWLGNEAAHQLPPTVTTLDGGGRFALPGLVDMSGQIGADPTAYVAQGITAVRDVGTRQAELDSWNDRRDTFGDSAPRLFSAGPIIETTPYLYEGSTLVATPEEARQAVRDAKLAGARSVYLHATLSPTLRRAIAQEAHAQGLAISAPSYQPKDIVSAAVFGLHSVGSMTPGSELYADLLQLLARTQIYWLPAPTESEAWLAGVKRAHAEHVPLLAGSGALQHDRLNGPTLHVALARLVQAGLTPAAALRLATETAAGALGAQDHLGKLQAGKWADLVLLDKNPLEDIRHTSSISHVVIGGQVLVGAKR